MKKKTGKKKKVNKKFDQRKRDQYTVVLEDINSKMDLLVEGHQSLNSKVDKGFKQIDERFRQIDERFDNLENRFDKFENRFDKFENRFDKFENRFDKFEKETKDNFEAVFGYLSRIEDEIMEMKLEIKDLKEKKVEKVRLAELEERVIKLERKVERKRVVAKV